MQAEQISIENYRNDWILTDYNTIQIETNSQGISNEFTNSSKLNSSFIKPKCVKEDMAKFMEFNKNERTTPQNIWDALKALPREIFIVLRSYK